MNDRTYGTYEYRPPKWAEPRSRGWWVLKLEPAVRARAKRVFGRLQPSRSTALVMADTIEVARDLTWFMERFPLEPADDRSVRWLEQGAQEHRRQDELIAQITAGTFERTYGNVQPTKEAREYQLAAIDLLRNGSGRLMLTDEVGLGKTFTGLLGLTHDDALPALVVAPTHLPPRWVDELKEAFPWLTFEVAKSGKPSTRVRAGILADVTIVSYSKIPGWAPELQNQIQTVLLDEAQEIRHGDKTDKGAAVAMVCDNASYVLGLTATPIHNYGGEIWNIYNIIAPGALGTREEFSREWGGQEMSNNRMSVKDPSTLGDYLREQGLMLGRTRAEVGRELPQTIKISHLIDSNTDALAKVQGSVKALAELILDDTTTHQEKFTAGGQIDMILRKATGVDKAPFVAEWCRMLLEAEDKIVLWGWHRDVYDIWLDKLADFNPVLYTGSESPKQKQEALDRFCTPRTAPAQTMNEKGETITLPSTDSRVLIMSLRSGAGIDGLQKHAQVGVFGELDWSPTVHEQAIGRLRRDGMGDDPAVIYFLNSSEGSDPVILEKLQVKRMQAEPMLSRDGQMFAPAATDPNRARRLAEQILGIKPTTEGPNQ